LHCGSVSLIPPLSARLGLDNNGLGLALDSATPEGLKLDSNGLGVGLRSYFDIILMYVNRVCS